MINHVLVSAVFLLFCCSVGSASELLVRTHLEENNQAVELLKQGRYSEGIELLKKSREADPYHPVLKKNLEFAYLVAADNLLKEKRYQAAAELLSEAQEFDDEKREFWTLRGFALLHMKEYGEAEAELQEALGMEGADGTVFFWLAQIYYNTDRMYDALDALEQAFAVAPNNSAIAEMLVKVRRELAVEGLMAKEYGGHFVITFDGERNEALAAGVLETLEAAYNWIGAQLDHYPQEQVVVLLYTDQQFRDLTDSPDWAGGVYDGKIRLPVGGVAFVNDEVRRLLYHEYMHVVLRDITKGNLPVWLNEGMAQAAESRIDSSVLNALEQMADGQQWLTMRQLEEPFTRLERTQVGLAYRQSSVLVRYLLDNYGWHVVADLLLALRQGLAFGQAFETVFAVYGLSYSDLVTMWESK